MPKNGHCLLGKCLFALVTERQNLFIESHLATCKCTRLYSFHIWQQNHFLHICISFDKLHFQAMCLFVNFIMFSAHYFSYVFVFNVFETILKVWIIIRLLMWMLIYKGYASLTGNCSLWSETYVFVCYPASICLLSHFVFLKSFFKDSIH